MVMQNKANTHVKISDSRDVQTRELAGVKLRLRVAADTHHFHVRLATNPIFVHVQNHKAPARAASEPPGAVMAAETSRTRAEIPLA
ncbi:hypothetical protein EVAR_16161_1 [Eumeta japonica]|uniref:Uncharacterized protein n=1 Tax=Eumeta variegata TaxID=151549 RepID=A0A4C1WDF3_EUMVA|nr:hypothetical protein EVAR_16161_1 [Eumeta japonica]